MDYKRIILDQYDEIAAGHVSTESLAKQAKVARVQGSDIISRLDDDDFAVVIVKQGEKFRRYPVNTATNTDLSKDAFLRNQNKMTMDCRDIAETRLKNACSRFSLKSEELEAKLASADSPYYLHTHIQELEHLKTIARQSMDKTASMKKFAIDAMRNGRPIQKFPINTKEEMKQAALDITVKLPVEWFLKAAQALIATSQEAKVDLPESSDVHLLKNSSLSPAFRGEIIRRIKSAKGDATFPYSKLLKTAESGDLPSVAITLENLDVQFGNRTKWGRSLLHPIHAVFMPKKAEMIEIDAGSIDSNKLSEYVADNKDAMISAIGQEATQSLIDDPATAFRALPAPHRQYVSEHFGGSA